ncbi:MAG: copper resistance CopC/CopD family protein [Candidatus Limnocylindrales bacterium]
MTRAVNASTLAGSIVRALIAACVALALVGAATAAGHSQLVSSSPGAGQVVPTSPSQLRLIFSEPIEGRYTSLDLLDATGRALLVGAGHVDPADPNALVADLSDTLSDGAYTVSWRAVSASDGHNTNGFLTFGVGQATLPPGSGQAGVSGGDLHAGHSSTNASLEVFGKTLGYGGAMLAFGLWIVGALVLLPVRGRWPPGLLLGQAAALLGAAAGAATLAWVEVSSLPAQPPVTDANGVTIVGQSADILTFLTTSRIGELLGARFLVALGAWGLVLLLAARIGAARPGIMAAIGGLAGAISIVLIALMSHSAAFDPPIPLVLDIVHLGAGAVWGAGLAVLAVMTGLGSGPVRDELRAVVPRFSALALATGGLLAATGVYAAWTMTQDFTTIGNDYSLNLVIKVVIVVAALALGAINLFDGGRDRYPAGLARRIAVEAALAFAVIVATANLTSGSPPGEGRPVTIAPAATSATNTVPASLALQPALPGPNQAWVGFTASAPSGGKVTLVLQRLDTDQGTSTVELAASPPAPGAGGPPTYTASGLLLPPDSRWDATVVVADATNHELGRQRFTFAFDASALSQGRQTPPIDPALLVGILLLTAAVIGLGFWIGGGRPPLVEARLGRQVLAVGSALGGLLGVLVLLGPR